MPASTFEILSTNWEDEEKVLSEIFFSCQEAGIYFFTSKGQIVVKLDEESEYFFQFEIRSEKTIKWYYEVYPLSRGTYRKASLFCRIQRNKI